MEENISNLSYINKDFISIYTELLDLVKKITNKWDPSLSNESDPGVVLLKLCALVADKNNYNIDKNILELFPLSVTQTGNARELYSYLGYSMKWYRSAITSILFSYTGDDTSSDPIDIDKFTMITNSDNSSIYTILNKVRVERDKNISTEVQAIEGIIKDYEINGNTIIQINNLDAYSRLYFVESQVAENGIFITNEDFAEENEWQAVDNLEATQLGQKVYKFGVLPNSNTCYIEFPQDIANLIEGGLKIKYIISNGEAGNIKASVLDSFYTDIKINDELINDIIVITNKNPALNGANPETLDAAYNNYKQICGTFNNLITCKDYESAIKRIIDPDINSQYSYLVSNCIVSDRNNDVHRVDKITSLNEYGEEYIYAPTSNTESMGKMTAFDLGLYPLLPMSNIISKESFETSFRPGFSLNSEIDTFLEQDLGYYKSINHDFISNGIDTSPYIYLNICPINCKIITYNKVTNSEIKTIVENIKAAIYRNFNARELNFGEALDYDRLHDVIINADTNIKSIILDEPVYTTKLMQVNGDLKDLNTDDLKKIYVKSILQGNTPYYKPTDRFNLNLNDTNSSIINNIRNITTELNLTQGIYTLQENQNIQCITPSYKILTNYSSGVRYTWIGTIFPKANEIFTTDSNNYVKVTYKKDGVEYTDTYNNHLIRFSFDISAANTSGYLNTTNILEIVEQSKVEKTSTDRFYYYFISNKRTENDYIFNLSEDTNDYILNSGEYFIYTTDLQSLNILGSGTRLQVDGLSSNELIVPRINTSEIFENGISVFSENDWLKLRNNQKIILEENELLILGPGAKIDTNIDLSSTEYTLLDTNSGNSFKYTVNDKTTSLDGKWKVRSILNLNCSKNSPQTLKTGEKITLKYFNTELEDISEISINPGQSIQFNAPVFMAGGKDLDAIVLNSDGTLEYSLSAYIYTNSTLDIDYESFFAVKEISESDTTFSIPTPDDNMTYIVAFKGNLTDSFTGQILNKDFDYKYFIASKGNNELSFTQNQSILISRPIEVEKVNSLVRDIDVSALEKGYNFLTNISEENLIENPCDPIQFFNSNHPLNHFTISKIDIDNSKFEVVKSSKV